MAMDGAAAAKRAAESRVVGCIVLITVGGVESAKRERKTGPVYIPGRKGHCPSSSGHFALPHLRLIQRSKVACLPCFLALLNSVF